jgi:hypothetical protein
MESQEEKLTKKPKETKNSTHLLSSSAALRLSASRSCDRDHSLRQQFVDQRLWSLTKAAALGKWKSLPIKSIGTYHFEEISSG